ncbi:hypothetical protein [Pseudomonas sp. MWU16-30317]|uniref:hypothetical protein n=1 Tax=Pseudomonas sp. MWU16-30317 TaxID=2878095 RepID=UPI001CFA68C0|nr:hypothetical protein [Pseudomonas sp. MWU16-30317]
MNPTRAHLALFACLLLLLVLFNGMACSVSHGQMMRSMLMPKPAPAHGHQQGHTMGGMGDMAAMPGMAMHDTAGTLDTASNHDMPMPGMNSLFGDCFFAGSMPINLIVFALIGWLLRHREARPKAYLTLFSALPRTLLPNLKPRAP